MLQVEVGSVPHESPKDQRRQGGMMYYFVFEGMQIKCDTLEELRAAVGSPTEGVRGDANARSRKRSSRRYNATGVKRLWELANWYARRIDKSRDEARKILSKMRKESRTEYDEIVQQFETVTAQDHYGRGDDLQIEAGVSSLP
jgi:hypothetical protein